MYKREKFFKYLSKFENRIGNFIKSRILRWPGHTYPGGKKAGILSNVYQVNLQERILNENLCVDGETLSEYILKKCLNTMNSYYIAFNILCTC